MFNTNLMLYKIQINNVFCLVKILVTLNSPSFQQDNISTTSTIIKQLTNLYCKMW